MNNIKLEHLRPSDIINIGGTIFNENGNTAFVCGMDSASVEKLFLIELLAKINPDYKIIEYYEMDMMPDPEISPDSAVYVTNLPYDEYERIMQEASETLA